ncbi:MAG TPA: glycosyltransferase family 1 protein [Patescibacteria group bacterium]|nr:glycosyltransferase family 1 protein [Patescibacteria group bacterium]
MQIGIDIRCLQSREKTGVGEYAEGLLTALFAQDKSNDYWLFSNGRKNTDRVVQRWAQSNVHYAHTTFPNKLLNFLLAIGLTKIDRRLARAGVPSLDIFLSLNLNFLRLGSKVKHILVIHDLSFIFFPQCFTRRQRWWHYFIRAYRQCQKAKKIIAPSFNTKNDLQQAFGLAGEKIEVVRPGLCPLILAGTTEADKARVKEKYGLVGKMILFLGTLEPRKNLVSLLLAFSHSSLAKTGLTLVIAGAGGWKNEREKELLSKISGTRLLGYVADTDKAALYAQAEFFVYPSLYEGFGFPPLEAMAMGTPVIVSARSSLTEVVGQAGYYVNPRQVEEIAAALKTMAADSILRESLARAGQERARSFSWDVAAQQVINLISSV